jgi:two-component system sensor histidine kinase HydH
MRGAHAPATEAIVSRQLVLQVTAPAVVIGLVLVVACLASAWSIDRLQRNLADILSENVTSLEAAGDLEAALRQLRTRALLYVMDPTPARLEGLADAQQDVESALGRADRTASTKEERQLVVDVRTGYSRYCEEVHAAAAAGPRLPGGGHDDLLTWADAHHVRHLMPACQRLVQINKSAIDRTVRESESVGGRARWGMLLVGLAAPAAGLVAGYGMARALSRSIARLRVHVEGVHAHLEEVGEVRLAAGGDLEQLDRQLGHVVVRVREVVEQMQQARAEALRAEQLGAVGRLAAGVAHEVRNPLMAIKMLVGSALRERGGPGLTAEDLRVIHGEIGRLEETVQSLLDFARPQPPRRGPCDLTACAADAADLVRPRASQQRVVIDVQRPDGPVTVSADAGQVRGLLVNLLLNACDAMPRGGRVSVEVGASGGDARLTVCDTGPGIAADVLPKLFTPFVSTKPTGTGLGLSVCRRVARDHGGDITADNRPEGGACFTVTLPGVVRPEEELATEVTEITERRQEREREGGPPAAVRSR